MMKTEIPTNSEQITGREATDLFLAAIDGADAPDVTDGGSWRAPDGTTWTRTHGAYADGQTCEGWHVRDADGEFVDFIPA